MQTCKRLATAWRNARRPLTAVVFAVLFVRPARAQVTNSTDCQPPSEFEPLMGMLDSITQLAFLGGIGLATLGFAVAGILMMMPGEDNNRRGKAVAKNVLFGTIILLSSHLIVGFLVSQLNNGVFC